MRTSFLDIINELTKVIFFIYTEDVYFFLTET